MRSKIRCSVLGTHDEGHVCGWGFCQKAGIEKFYIEFGKVTAIVYSCSEHAEKVWRRFRGKL